MEALTDQETKARKGYRLALSLGLLVVAGMTVWFLLPPRPIDLRFLSGLHPQHRSVQDDQTTLTLDQAPADVMKFLDERMKGTSEWSKSSYGMGTYANYTHTGHSRLSITVTGTSWATPTPTGASSGMPHPPTPKGTSLVIEDPRRIAILP